MLLLPLPPQLPVLLVLFTVMFIILASATLACSVSSVAASAPAFFCILQHCTPGVLLLLLCSCICHWWVCCCNAILGNDNVFGKNCWFTSGVCNNSNLGCGSQKNTLHVVVVVVVAVAVVVGSGGGGGDGGPLSCICLLLLHHVTAGLIPLL